MSTKELAAHVRSVAEAATVLVLHESATVPLAAMGLGEAASLMLLIGPEGGIGDDELRVLTDAGATAVRLGPSVLRTTSAAAVALGALGVLTPRWHL
jgi:16S rRNA (uracil1498-N3)-methyltransferase